MGRNEASSSVGISFGPLLFLPDIHDFPRTINDKTIPIMSADDTSILVTGTNK
jgi:hypothetical protein